MREFRFHIIEMTTNRPNSAFTTPAPDSGKIEEALNMNK